MNSMTDPLLDSAPSPSWTHPAPSTRRITVELIDGTRLTWTGDVEMSVNEGVLTVYNYSDRKNTDFNGLILCSDKGAWLHACVEP
jgi:hypothetical protein